MTEQEWVIKKREMITFNEEMRAKYPDMNDFWDGNMGIIEFIDLLKVENKFIDELLGK